MTDTTTLTGNDRHSGGDSSTDLVAIVDDYLAAWNATDPTVRAAAIDAVYAGDARLCDPLVDVRGHEQLAAVFAHFHEAYPGCTFRRHGAVEGHHDLARWAWQMVDAAGNVQLDGIDVATIEHGKLVQVAGFFGLALAS